MLLGLLGLVERMLKHAMHAAAMIGLLGCIAAATRFVPKLLKGVDFTDPATISTGGMTLLSHVFVGLCVNSFIQVRGRRRPRRRRRRPRGHADSAKRKPLSRKRQKDRGCYQPLLVSGETKMPQGGIRTTSQCTKKPAPTPTSPTRHTTIPPYQNDFILVRIATEDSTIASSTNSSPTSK